MALLRALLGLRSADRLRSDASHAREPILAPPIRSPGAAPTPRATLNLLSQESAICWRSSDPDVRALQLTRQSAGLFGHAVVEGAGLPLSSLRVGQRVGHAEFGESARGHGGSNGPTSRHEDSERGNGRSSTGTQARRPVPTAWLKVQQSREAWISRREADWLPLNPAYRDVRFMAHIKSDHWQPESARLSYAGTVFAAGLRTEVGLQTSRAELR